MNERKKPGPKIKYQEGRSKELHLKFVPDLAAYIERRAEPIGYQAYFDELVRRDMEQGRDEQPTVK